MVLLWTESKVLTRDAEICDFGFPQNSEIDTLKSYITTESVMSSGIAAVRAHALSC